MRLFGRYENEEQAAEELAKIETLFQECGSDDDLWRQVEKRAQDFVKKYGGTIQVQRKDESLFHYEVYEIIGCQSYIPYWTLASAPNNSKHIDTEAWENYRMRVAAYQKERKKEFLERFEPNSNSDNDAKRTSQLTKGK